MGVAIKKLFCNARYKYNKKPHGESISTAKSSACGGEVRPHQQPRRASPEVLAPSRPALPAGPSEVQAWLSPAAPPDMPGRKPPPVPLGAELTSSPPGVTPHVTQSRSLQLAACSWLWHLSCREMLSQGCHTWVCICPQTQPFHAGWVTNQALSSLSPRLPRTQCANLNFNTFCWCRWCH